MLSPCCRLFHLCCHHVVDYSTCAVTVLQMLDQGLHPVLAVKTARVGDFNGKTLSTLGGSLLNLDPDIPEAGTLRNW